MKTKVNYTNSNWLVNRQLKSLPLVEFAVEATSGVRNMDPRFFKYQKDPVLFCKEVLKEEFPMDIERLMMSVVDNKVSIAKSANAIGKCKLLIDKDLEVFGGSTRTIESLIDQDFLIYSVDDKLKRKVSKAYARDNGIKEGLRITTDMGKTICCTTNHPLMTADSVFEHANTPRIGKYKWATADSFKVGDIVLTVQESPYEGFDTMNEDEVKIIAYLIGDGCLRGGTVSFTQQNGVVLDEFIQSIENLGAIVQKKEKSSNPMDYLVRLNGSIVNRDDANPVYRLIKEIGLWDKNSHQKFIPQCINTLPNSQLVLFLSRLYATDGWATGSRAFRNRQTKYGQQSLQSNLTEIGYCSVSRQLSQDVQRLLLRLGITSILREKKTTWTHNGEEKHGIAYSVDILESEMIIKFADTIGIFGKENAINNVREIAKEKRIRRRYVWRTKNLPDGYQWEKIRKIENLGMQPSVAITVPGDNTYLTDFVEHNTFAAARIAIWFYKCFPGSKVFLAAAPPEDNLKRLLWGQIELLMLKHPSLFENDTPVSLMVSTDPEWYIKGLSIPSSGSPHEKVAKFSGKHAPYILFILDEGDAIPDECYEGIETCLSGGHARMLIMFNPRNQSGPVYIKEQKGEGNFVVLSAFSHPNVISGLDLIPGAVTREVTVARINKYTRPVVDGDDLSHSIFELPSFLVGATAEADDKSIYPPLVPGLRKIIESKFSYMVLGEYPAQTENQLISLSWVKKAQQRWMDYTALHGDSYPQDTRPIMGLDVAEMGADYNVLCLRYGGYVPKMEFWSGMFPVQTGEKASRVYHLSSASKAFVDAMTVGTDVAPTMQKMGCTCIGVKVSTSPTKESDLGAFSQLRDQLYWSIREWLKDDSSDAMLPPDKLLEEELLSLTYEIPDGKIKVTPKPVLRNRLRRSPDRLDALALTFTQESDKLLHFYDNIAVCEYDRETASIIVKYDGNNVFENNTETPGNVDIISLSDMLDFGFVSTTKDFSSWSICRLWLSSSGKIILPEIWRVEHNDPRMVVEKIFESHKKRKFRCVGCHSELSKFLRPHWNDLENELYSYNEGLATPELVSIKALDRINRQLIIRDIAKMKGAGVLRNVIDRKDIWGQFGHCESKPDDSRDALAGAIRLILRET